MAKEQRGRTAQQNRDWAEGKLAPTALDFMARFGSEEDCEDYLISLRYPDGFVCEECGCTEYVRVGGRREFRCRGCNRQFSATSGTMLAHTKIPLTKWFWVAFMLVMDTRGVSAQRVARECGVSDVTGLAMLRRLRTAMGFAMSLCKVGGEYVEVDGAHVACGNDGTSVTPPGSGKTDAPVIVAASSDRCVIRATSDSNGATMEEFASAHVSRNHQVRCDLHGANNTLVGGWDVLARKSEADGDSEASLPRAHHILSNLKSWLVGTFHGVSVSRLQEYCDEFSWAYCHRKGDPLADLLAELVRWPHVKLEVIRGCRTAMEPHDPPKEPGEEHNKYLRRKWQKKVEAERKEAEEAAARVELPQELIDLLDEAFNQDEGSSETDVRVA